MKVWKAILTQIAVVSLVLVVSFYVLPKLFGDIGWIYGLLLIGLTVLIDRRFEQIRDFMRLHINTKNIIFGFITLVVIPIIVFQATLDILPDADIILRIMFSIMSGVAIMAISVRIRNYGISFRDIGYRDTSSKSPFQRNEDEKYYSDEKRNEDDWKENNSEQSYSDKKTHENNLDEQFEYTLEECYDILGLKNDATTQEIKKAYQQLALQWHPDKHRQKQRKDMAAEEMKKINKAYEELTKSK